MTKVVVVGAAGFGREVLDTLEAMAAAGAEIDILGVIDDSPSEINLTRLAERGIEYLGTIANWLKTEESSTRFVLGIGNPGVRRALVEKIEAAGLTPFAVVHPSAIIGTRTELAEGLVICAGAVVSTNVSLGRHVHINPNATIGHDATLNDYVSINPNATISGEVHIESEVLVGASATVLQNLTVGSKSIIGAGAVITREVVQGQTLIGVPGRSLVTESSHASGENQVELLD